MTHSGGEVGPSQWRKSGGIIARNILKRL